MNVKKRSVLTKIFADLLMKGNLTFLEGKVVK